MVLPRLTRKSLSCQLMDGGLARIDQQECSCTKFYVNSTITEAFAVSDPFELIFKVLPDSDIYIYIYLISNIRGMPNTLPSYQDLP